MPLIEMLEGLSPWYWVALAFVLGALEMATGTAVLIWAALGALVMALLLALMPNMSGELQLTLYAVISVGLTFAGRHLIQRFGDGEPEVETLNQRSQHLVGRTAKVLDFHEGAGAVEIEGMRWRATWEADQKSKAGGTVRVTNAEGMTLTVTNV